MKTESTGESFIEFADASANDRDKVLQVTARLPKAKTQMCTWSQSIPTPPLHKIKQGYKCGILNSQLLLM